MAELLQGLGRAGGGGGIKEARAWIKRSGDVAAQTRLANKEANGGLDSPPGKQAAPCVGEAASDSSERQQGANVRWCKQRGKAAARRDETRREKRQRRRIVQSKGVSGEMKTKRGRAKPQREPA